MTPNQLIIAVETAGLTAAAGPVVASAIAHMSDAVEPVFIFEDRFGEKRKRYLLRDPEDVPQSLRQSLREYLTRSCVGVSFAQRDAAYIREHGLPAARLKAANVAVLRLFERMAQTRPDLAGIGLESIQVFTAFDERLEDLPDVIHQHPHTAGTDWRINSALVLARDRHQDAMVALAERHPRHGFETHLGQLTSAHRRAIKAYGLTPDHRLPTR